MNIVEVEIEEYDYFLMSESNISFTQMSKWVSLKQATTGNKNLEV